MNAVNPTALLANALGQHFGPDFIELDESLGDGSLAVTFEMTIPHPSGATIVQRFEYEIADEDSLDCTASKNIVPPSSLGDHLSE